MLLRHPRLLTLAGLIVFISLAGLALRLSHTTLFPLPSFGRGSKAGSGPSIDHVGESDGTGKIVAPGAIYIEGAYNELSSVSTRDKKYFTIDFGAWEAINPNVIPHPSLGDTWIIVAQKQRSDVKNSVFFSELVCNAKFKDGFLACVDSPLLLPIGITHVGDECTGDQAYYGWSVGPHDARVFYGPSVPYTIYGSPARHACLGQWILDFRVLVDWGFEFFDKEQFRLPTELQRPPPYGFMEKNYFLFWDKNEQLYIHHDVAPKRVFAQLAYDGSVGPNLAPEAAASDDKCMAKHMPTLTPHETLHQATNSLSITLCKRSDTACEPDDSNTFIITIFQNKRRFSEHLIYDPYVMLFDRTAPFAIHGITSKPLWINGRAKQGEWKSKEGKKMDQTQFFYITSMSWKAHDQKYHGYIDDVIFVLFGIEDASTGGIDVVAGDLLKGLYVCGGEE